MCIRDRLNCVLLSFLIPCVWIEIQEGNGREMKVNECLFPLLEIILNEGEEKKLKKIFHPDIPQFLSFYSPAKRGGK